MYCEIEDNIKCFLYIVYYMFVACLLYLIESGFICPKNWKYACTYAIHVNMHSNIKKYAFNNLATHLNST